MASRIKLLLCRHAGIDDDRLEAALATEAMRLEAELSTTPEVRRAYAIRDESFHKVAAGAFDAASRPFDAIMDITTADAGDLDRLADRLAGLSGRLDGLVEPAVSGVLGGVEHVIIPGGGPVMVVIANRRLPRFTHEGFLDYWLDYHGPFAREHTPPEIGFRYTQFHADPVLSRRLAQATGFGLCDFDGAAECFYPDQAAVRTLMGLTEVVDQATVDELEFVDHARCVTSVLALRPA